MIWANAMISSLAILVIPTTAQDLWLPMMVLALIATVIAYKLLHEFGMVE